MVPVTGRHSHQKYASLFCKHGISSKFIPKYPTKKVIGKNRMVTKVSCFMLSFWYAPIVLKIRLIMRSAERRMRSRDSVTVIQWSSTSPK